MRCLVTGGLGFIGSHLVDRLRRLKHEVIVWDIARPDTRQKFPVDLSADNLNGVELLEDLKIGIVFHLAACARTTHALQDPAGCHRINATGSLRLLQRVEIYQNATGAKVRVVLASSNIVYGSPNPYKASKLAMEHYMEAYNSLYGLNCIALRYSNVYGSRMRWDDPICLAALRRSKHEKGYIELTGDGKQSRDWTHVSDIVEGTIAAAQSDYKGVMDLTSGEHHDMNFMASLFECPIRYTADRPGDTKHIVQSHEMANRILHWQPRVTVAAGIKDVLAEMPQGVGV